MDYEELGFRIIEVFGLRLTSGKIKTQFGTKTPEGFARSIERVLDENWLPEEIIGFTKLKKDGSRYFTTWGS